MYTFIRAIPLQELLSRHLPVMTLSLVIAEVFYKFHSFTLECLAYLATWYVLNYLVEKFLPVQKPRGGKS